jgi:sortase A
MLGWLERGLLAVGIGLAAWCAMVLIEAHFVASLPVTTAIPVAAPARSPAAALATPLPEPPVGTFLGRLEAPSVHLSAAVLEGDDDGTLRLGAGHIQDTALPGEPGNVGVAGHRDTTFRAVRNLHPGDELDFVTRNHTYHYQITQTFVVNPEEVSVLDPTPEPALTLVTCYPFTFLGHAPRRFIVRAVLIDGGP